MQRKRWAGVGVVSVVFGGACWGEAAPQTGCASSPAAAIEAARAGRTAAVQATGYRVESVRWDVAQRQTWAVIRSCDHAERPTFAVLADLPHGRVGPAVAAAGGAVASSAAAPVLGPAAQANPLVAVVHAGEAVRLWRADGQAHIELMATAEENGTLGAKVRLRLTTAKDPDGQYAPPKYLAGIVRGPADVEMEQ